MQLGSSGRDGGYGGEKLAWYSDDLQSVLPVQGGGKTLDAMLNTEGE